MKNILNSLLFYIIYALWFVFSLLPLRILYIFSDLFYPLVYYVVGYRKKVVRKNLVESFPEKSMNDILKVEREFYRYFCDNIFETIKMFSMSENEMRRRMTMSGIDILFNESLHKSCVLYLGHFCNWEWMSSIPLHLENKNSLLLGQIYHELENPIFDRLFLHSRKRFYGENIEMHSALRTLVKSMRENKHFIVGFISDQSPNWNFVNMWTDFLHHKTSFFVGAENIAKLTDAAVFYVDVKRVRRGYYHAEFILMTNQPKEFPNYRLTVDYAKRMEDSINKNPQYWLWSHNRWKRTFEQYQELYPNGKAIIDS